MDKAAIALGYSVPTLLIVVGVVVILKLRPGGRYGRISTRTASIYLVAPAIAVIALLVLTATRTTSSAVPFLIALVFIPLVMLAIRIGLSKST
jgi:hypothetical protein